MKKSSKSVVFLLCLLCFAALFAGLYLSSRPEGNEGLRSISVTVVHGDNTRREFLFKSGKAFLGDLLLSEDLIKGDSGPYGLYITEVDGEVADYSVNKAYWALFEGESYAAQGIDTTPLVDGAHFRLVYTYG